MINFNSCMHIELSIEALNSFGSQAVKSALAAARENRNY